MQSFIIHGFENVIWLIIGCIFFVGAMLFFYFRDTKSNFIDEDLIGEVYGKSTYWYHIYVILLCVISILFFIILAGPYSDKKIEKIKKNGIDIEIVFDLSYSMVAEDLLPNRLEVAKNVFSDFIGSVQTDRVGLILFAGKAFQSIPLSYDYDFLNQFIEELDIDTIDGKKSNLQGTAIGGALILANDVLSQGEKEREKVIILITDGTANRGVDPSIALKLLKENNIKTYAIGVGKDGDTMIDVMVTPGLNQRVLVAGVDEASLKNIAQSTGGKYFRADSPGAFRKILDTISQLEKTELEIEIISTRSSRVEVFLLLLIFCFLPLGYIVFFKRIQL